MIRFFSRPTPHDHARALGTLGGKATDTGECFAPRFRASHGAASVSTLRASIAFAGARLMAHLNIRGRDFPHRTAVQLIWWFPEWCGLGIHAWGGASACMFRPSIALGFLEIRRWRRKAESERLFGAYRRQCEDEDAASAMSAGTAETAEQAQGEARQRGGEAETPND